MDIDRLIKSIVATFVAASLAKFGNENYEMLKEEGNILVPLLCLVGALILGAYGIVTFFRAISKR